VCAVFVLPVCCVCFVCRVISLVCVAWCCSCSSSCLCGYTTHQHGSFFIPSLSGSWNSLGSFLFIRRHYYGQFVCNNLPIFLIHPKVKKKQDTKCVELAILNLSVNRRKSVCWKSLNVFVMWTWNGIEVKILNFVGFSEKARNRREKSGLEKEREILFLLSLWKSRITPLGADVIGRQNKTFADPFLFTTTVYIVWRTNLRVRSVMRFILSPWVLLFHRLSIFNSQRNFLRKLLRSILQKVLKV
jgi:hypothetical protein